MVTDSLGYMLRDDAEPGETESVAQGPRAWAQVTGLQTVILSDTVLPQPPAGPAVTLHQPRQAPSPHWLFLVWEMMIWVGISE